MSDKTKAILKQLTLEENCYLCAQVEFVLEEMNK